MKKKVLSLLFVVTFILTGTCAYSAVLFQDDFTQDDGAPLKWDVVSGSFGVYGGIFVPGGGTSNWTDNLAAPKNLLVDQYVMTATVHTDSNFQDLWSIRVHQKDASNFLRVFIDNTLDTMYWQVVVGGAWLYDPPRYSVSLANMNKGIMSLTAVWNTAGASLTLTDGAVSATSMLPMAEIPVEVQGDSRVLLGMTTWNPAWVAFDNVVISEVPEPMSLLALVSGIATFGGLSLRRRRA